MNIKKALTKDSILLGLTSTTKQDAIVELLDFLVDAYGLTSLDKDSALQALLIRESKMSTGLQNGVAIPHAKITDVEQMYAVLAIKRSGMDFEALDGQPSQLFVMTLSPLGRAGPHIQFLAEISHILNDATVREKLLAAQTVEEILQLI